MPTKKNIRRKPVLRNRMTIKFPNDEDFKRIRLCSKYTPRSLATGFVGCAPHPIQYLIRSKLKLTSFSL